MKLRIIRKSEYSWFWDHWEIVYKVQLKEFFWWKTIGRHLTEGAAEETLEREVHRQKTSYLKNIKTTVVKEVEV